MLTQIKILFLYSNPNNLKHIRLDEEVSRIEDAIELAEFRDRIVLLKRGAVRPTDIQRALLKHRPHILHFSGHGSQTEGIFVQNQNGKAEFVKPEALADLLGIIKDNLFLVVFNACYSVAQAEAISQIVDCTIGMRDTIFDESAIEWSAALYHSLACGRSIYECFRLGNNSLMLQNIPEDHIPVLLTANGIDPAVVFPLSSKVTDAPQPIQPEPPLQNKDGTMQMEVVVLGRNTSRVIRAWRYATDDYRQLFISLDDDQDRQKPEDAWQGLLETSKSVSKVAGLTARLPPDIFLLLRGNLIETLHDHRRLQEMVNQAMYYAVGSNLYLVWSQPTTFPVLYQKNEALLEEWFSALVKSGVTDVIEIPKERRASRSDENRILRDYAFRSESRRERLRKLVSGEDWNLIHRGNPTSPRLSFQIFLDRFQREEQLLFSEGNNLAVFYDQRPKGGWSELLKNSRSLDRSGNWFIATVSRSNDLNELWTQEAHDSKPTRFDGVFEFEGIFEWLYALLRLKLAVRLAQSTSPNVAGKALF